MTNSEKLMLCKHAINAANNAYSPYSGFNVGAALLCKDGSVYLGCNVENASYSATNCAERVAVQSAIAEGKRDFAAIAIAGGKEIIGEEICPPCGICRQVLAEFCNPDEFVVLLAKNNEFEEHLLRDILPLSFTNEQFK